MRPKKKRVTPRVQGDLYGRIIRPWCFGDGFFRLTQNRRKRDAYYRECPHYDACRGTALARNSPLSISPTNGGARSV